MQSGRLSLATIGEDALSCARSWGLSLEVDESSFVENLQKPLGEWANPLLQAMDGLRCAVLHGPFCELLPASCDPLIVDVARRRFWQGMESCRVFQTSRMVVHSGFLPQVFYPEWFVEKTGAFWREFLAGQPEQFEILIENVLDPDPAVLAAAVDAIGDERVAVCLDVGHAFCAGKAPLTAWVKTLGRRIRHVHLHDNDGLHDRHWPMGAGNIPFEEVVSLLEAYAPGATYTIEGMQCEPSLRYLAERGFLEMMQKDSMQKAENAGRNR